MGRIILQGGLVVSLGAAGILDNGLVVIEDGRIVEVGERGRYTGLEVVDCAGRVILPGLTNAHLHSEFLLFKGLLEERRLDEWHTLPAYDRAWDRLEVPLDADLLLPALRASYLEQVLGGVTFVGEFNCAHGSAPLTEAVLAEVGLRGSAAFRPDEPPPEAEAHPLVLLHHERALSADELDRVGALLAAEPRVFCTMHAAETVERMAAVREKFGTTTVRLLERYGLLSPRLLLSHAVHVDEEEIGILARHGATVVASPTAEMKLSDGISPLVKYLEAGVRVCLGTDCGACNNGADLFLEMKILGLLHKLTSGAQVLPAETLLRLGTVEGRRAFGEWDAGLILPGFRADLVLLDRFSPNLVPLIHTRSYSNVCANLVYAATGRDVRDVMVGGEWVVRDGRHRSLEVAPVMRELQAAAERLWREVG